VKLISLQFHGLAVPDPWLALRYFTVDDGTSDAMSPIVPPEWRSGESVNPSDSPVAICRSLASNGLSVRAVFERSPSEPASLLVRAVDAMQGNLLGAVLPSQIEFQNELAIAVALPLGQVATQKVATHADRWDWQQAPFGSHQWTSFASSSHEVFVTLDVPQSPWDQTVESPVVEVFRLACRWALGATTVEQAASFITSSFYDLGQPSASRATFGYTGAPQFCDDNFDCAHIVAAINGIRDLVTVVDCADCASLVSTFANSLGAQLHEARIGDVFETRPIQLIGQSGMARTDFTFHEIAWSKTFQISDPVWDACLMIDQDSDPGSAPYSPGYVLGLPFGTSADRQYSWRLVNPKDAAGIHLLLKFYANRPIGKVIPRPRHADSQEIVKGSWFFWNFQILDQFLAPWQFRKFLYPPDGTLPVIDSTWRTAPNASSSLARVRVVAATTIASARATLISSLERYSSRIKKIDIGDVGYALDDLTQISFCRGNLVIDIGAASRIQVTVDDVARRLDRDLIRQQSMPTFSLTPRPVDITDWAPLQDPSGNPWSYRLFSPSGEIRAEKGRLEYHPAAGGTQTVTLFQHDSSGGVTPIVHQWEVS
jgi:hypothetical protein